MTVDPVDDDWRLDSKSGALSATERRAVTAEAMGLVAGYFATGEDSLRRSSAVGRDSSADDLTDLVDLVRLRVLLAEAASLEPLLRRVLVRTSFRYRRFDSESVGTIRGRLDTLRYLRLRHQITAPRRFPIQDVRRSHDLPENVLCVAAAQLLASEIRRIPLDRLPNDAVERVRADPTAEALLRICAHPAFAECVADASAALRQQSVPLLLDRCQRAISSGRVANAESYAAVLDWARAFDVRGIVVDSGSTDWLFYDETFDTRLFEIWSLHHLLEAMRRCFGEPTLVRALVDRGDQPVAQWDKAGLVIKVWFQAGFTKLQVGGAKWSQPPPPDSPADAPRPFGGIPDISVTVDRPGQPRQPILIDPKLRQRGRIPSPEIYKILGYFANLPDRHTHLGAIVFHGPQDARTYEIRDGAGGRVVAVGVDPLDPIDSAERFDVVASLVEATVPRSNVLRSQGPSDPSSDDSIEVWVDQCQNAAIEEMATQVDGDALAQAAKSLRSNLIATWTLLDRDTQRMLASAEHFGGRATPDMDHSGPVLGLAAGCERLLRLFVISVAAGIGERATFGKFLRMLRDSCGDDRGPALAPLRDGLTKRGIDRSLLAELVDDLFELNTRYRIPAAHADVMEEQRWIESRAAIVVGQNAFVPRIVRILHVNGVTATPASKWHDGLHGSA